MDADLCTSKALTHAKFSLRVLGAIVSAMFGAQGVLVFLRPEDEDFWVFCHWLGKGMLFFFLGGFGILLEVKGSISSVATKCTRFALNRIMLSVLYFWLGCYVMGGVTFKLHNGRELRVLAHVTGIIAWIVAVGDLLIACAADQKEQDSDDDERGLRDRKGSAEKSSSTTIGRNQPSTTYQPEGGWANTGTATPALSWNDSGVAGGPPRPALATAPARPGNSNANAGTALATIDQGPEEKEVEVDMPQWNTIGGGHKGFGSF